MAKVKQQLGKEDIEKIREEADAVRAEWDANHKAEEAAAGTDNPVVVLRRYLHDINYRVDENEEELKVTDMLTAAEAYCDELVELDPYPVIPLSKRINNIMADVSYLQKDSEVSTGKGSYHALTYDKLIKALHPAMVKHGVNFTFNIQKWGTQDIEGKYGTTNRTWADVYCLLYSADDKQDVIDGDSLGFGHGNDDKGPGKAITYACKAWLLKAFALESGDDPDQDNDGAYEPVKPKAERLSDMAALADGGMEEVKAYIKSLLNEGETIEAVKDIPENALAIAEAHYNEEPKA